MANCTGNLTSSGSSDCFCPDDIHELFCSYVDCSQLAGHQRLPVFWGDELLQFTGRVAGVSGVSTLTGRAVLQNWWNESTTLQRNVNTPDWITVTGGLLVGTVDPTILNHPNATAQLFGGSQFAVEFDMDLTVVPVGRQQVNLSFTVYGHYPPECRFHDAVLPLEIDVLPPQRNYIGSLVSIGYIMVAAVVASSLYGIIWVYQKRSTRVIQVVQPLFLYAIAAGTLVLGLSIVPISLTDEFVSDNGADAACAITPWFVILGLSVIFSALLSKLRTLNQMSNSHETGSGNDDTRWKLPLVVMFGLNFLFLLLRTVLDPPASERGEIDGDPANTIATCSDSGGVGGILSLLSALMIMVAYVTTCVRAWKARNNNDEYNESKHMGIGVFIWTEILLIGIPIQGLVGFDSPTTTYFVSISLVFFASMSMLTAIFVPIVLHDGQRRGQGTARVSRSSATTVPTNTPTGSSVERRSILARLEERLRELERENEELRSVHPGPHAADGATNK